MHSRTTLSLLAIAALAAKLGGCGYRISGKGEWLPDDVQVIGVPAFENQTSWMGAEQRLTEAVMREFIHRSRFDIVGSEEGADAVLRGKVLSVRTLPVIFDPDTGRASAVQIELRLSVELKDLHEDRLLFSRADYAFREEYEITSDLASFFDERNPALDRLARDFAATLVSAVLERY